MINFIRNLKSEEWDFLFGEMLIDIVGNPTLDCAEMDEIGSADKLLKLMVHPYLALPGKRERLLKLGAMLVPDPLPGSYVSVGLGEYITLLKLIYC
jgi:hypothetical protein